MSSGVLVTIVCVALFVAYALIHVALFVRDTATAAFVGASQWVAARRLPRLWQVLHERYAPLFRAVRTHRYLLGATATGLAIAAVMHALALPFAPAPETRAVRAEISDERQLVAAGPLFGYSDTQGRVVIAPRFRGARSFHEGLAPVSTHNRWGYIDPQGNVVIPERYLVAGTFRNGKALVGMNLQQMAEIDKDGRILRYVNVRDVNKDLPGNE